MPITRVTQQVSDYRVITTPNEQAPTSIVKASMQSGWQPHGGVSITVLPTGLADGSIWFAQALVMLEFRHIID